jgi:hypothetical protein
MQVNTDAIDGADSTFIQFSDESSVTLAGLTDIVNINDLFA